MHLPSRAWLRVLLLIPGLLMLCPDPAAATWQRLGPLPGTSAAAARSIFFLDELTGWAGYSLQAGGLAIARTTDGGNTWLSTALSWTSNSGYVSDIFMLDGMNGWATVDAVSRIDTASGNFNRGVFRTTDGGVTWTSVRVLNDATSVFQQGSTVIITARGPGYRSKISTDGGMNFRDLPITSVTDVDFVDPLRGVMSRFEDGSWHQSQDGGQTWNIVSNGVTESWSVYGAKGTPRFYVAPEHDPRSRPATGGTTVLRSDDYGLNWQATATFGFYTTGHLGGVREVLYTQVENLDIARTPGGGGVYRSTNQGVTWMPVGGPVGRRDSRFAVTGCNGGIVYVSDPEGIVWKTRDGGDGAIEEPPALLQFSEDSIILSAPICAGDESGLAFVNRYCFPDSVVRVDFYDSLQNIVRTGALSLLRSPLLPKSYAAGEGDSIVLYWDPSLFAGGDRRDSTWLRIRFFSHVSKRFVDRLIKVITYAIAEPPSVLTNTPISLGEFTACEPKDTVVSIRNTACDTLAITSGTSNVAQGTLLQDLLGTAVRYPILVPPDSTVTIPVHINAQPVGAYASTLTFQLQHQGRTGQTSLSLTGNVITTAPQFTVSDDPGTIVLDSAVLDRGTMTRCDSPQVFYLYAKNPGCTAVSLRNVTFLGNGVIFQSGLERSLPDTLNWDKMHRIEIRVYPRGLGQYRDTLRIRYRMENGLSETYLYPFVVDIGYGTRLLSMTTEPHVFDTVAYCKTDDTLIRYQNLGCDTLTITNLYITGADFTWLNSVRMPIKIPPGESRDLRLRYDPVLPGSASGSVTVESDADVDSLRLIVLTGDARPTDTVTFRLEPERLPIYTNDTTRLLLFPNRTIRGKGLMSLRFLLTYNGDVFTYQSATSTAVGVSLINVSDLAIGKKMHQAIIQLNGATDIELDSTRPLLVIGVRTTLSDSTHATVELLDMRLNGGDNTFAKCLLGARTEAMLLDLDLLCGDSIIKKTLLHGRIVLDLMPPHPNPSSSIAQISLPFDLNVASDVTLEVFDSKGTLLEAQRIAHPSGPGEFVVSADKLASGVHAYRLTCGSYGSRTGQFVVTR